jgi:hypothetical protein
LREVASEAVRWRYLLADLSGIPLDVRFWAISGQHMLNASSSPFDPKRTCAALNSGLRFPSSNPVPPHTAMLAAGAQPSAHAMRSTEPPNARYEQRDQFPPGQGISARGWARPRPNSRRWRKPSQQPCMITAGLSRAEWMVTLCPLFLNMTMPANRFPFMLNALVAGGTRKWPPTVRFQTVLPASAFST